jgi:hypothetical protein
MLRCLTDRAEPTASVLHFRVELRFTSGQSYWRKFSF